MIRSVAAERAQSTNKEFRYRGKEPGRLESFSDASFATAIALLLISSSPPTNFDDIRKFVWELLPFTLCFVLMLLIWYEYFVFYYRYGLRDGTLIVLNSLFLIIVLFYVYPLKFLARLCLIPVSMLFGANELRTEVMSTIKGSDIDELMIIYGSGAAAVSLVLVFMYRHALSKAKELELNEIEVFDTKTSIRTNFLMALVPMLSVVTAIAFSSDPLLSGMIPGFTYFLYTPIMWIHGVRRQKARQKLIDSLS